MSKENKHMIPVELKNYQYKVLIDIQKKQIIISKKNLFQFYCHRKIAFSKINKIILELSENNTIHFIIETTNHKIYTMPILFSCINENDFIIFLIFLKNSQLAIEDKKHIIDHILNNDMYLEKLY